MPNYAGSIAFALTLLSGLALPGAALAGCVLRPGLAPLCSTPMRVESARPPSPTYGAPALPQGNLGVAPPGYGAAAQVSAPQGGSAYPPPPNYAAPPPPNYSAPSPPYYGGIAPPPMPPQPVTASLYYCTVNDAGDYCLLNGPPGVPSGTSCACGQIPGVTQ